ncbi:MAG: respiratory nitrate reductase subunit gamma [Anaerolineae bacterium]
MSGVGIVQVFAYVAAAVFLLGMARRGLRYARTPMHLRWELYPVPHEKGKDGSYFEELDWWEKPRHSSPIGELKVMLPEILLLVGLWEHNRKLWFASFPFHVGIYITILFLVLLLGSGIAQAAGAPVTADSNAAALHYATIVVGVVGIVSTGLGALGLLVMRLTDPGLRLYAVPADFFNLGLILAMALLALVSWAAIDQSFTQAREYAQGLVSFEQPADTSPLIVAQSLILTVFLIYLPFTHMTHFLGKFFTYHLVRWDDTPNVRGSDYERLIADLLQRPVSWSAPHVQSGKSWAEVATEVEE